MPPGRVLPPGWLYHAGLAFWLAVGLNCGFGAQLRTVPGHRPAAAARLQPVDRLPATNQLRLALGLPLRDQDGLAHLLRQLYDPASPQFQRYLTPAEFTEQFGPSAADYGTLLAFAQTNGLVIIEAHPNRVVLDVSGSVANIERAFHVNLRLYEHPTEARRFYAPDAEPTLEVSVPLLHVSGLDNYSLPHPLIRHQRPPHIARTGTDGSPAPRSGSGTNGAYLGNDFRAAYVPGTPLTGDGESVGLLQFDGYYASDIAAYESMAGLPRVQLVNVPVDGGVSVPGSGNIEVCLDIEMALSMAPNLATIYVYQAPNPSPWVDLLSRMANDNFARQLSCSWGGGGPDPTAEGIFQQMAAQGQSFFNASGDSDAFVGAIEFPSDSTNITEVGGTTLTTGLGGSYSSETVWNWGGGAGSSGGISTYYGIPAWQTGVSMLANGGSTTMRNVPDVALTADNVYVRYNNGSSGVVGGTSCAAPLWAGLTALINQQARGNGRPPVGFLNPALYAIGTGGNYASAFHDVTAGDNTSSRSPARFYAVPGYDLCTGWGTPAGQGLIDALAGPADPLQIAPYTGFASSGGAGGPFTITAQTFSVTNAGASPLTWRVGNTAAWLSVSPESGALPPGGLTSVAVTLNSVASSLAAGSYGAALWFTNLNDGVSQDRNFTLTILGAPVITSQPSSQSVLEGSTAVFTVGVIGLPPLAAQWRFQGLDLPGTTNLILTLPAVRTNQAGGYSVVVTNSVGAATSAVAVLEIVPAAANDVCAEAIAILQDRYTNVQTTAIATSAGDPVPTCVGGFGNGVWYSFTPPSAGQLVVDTIGSSFDTGLAVYAGECDALTELACDDDSGGNLASRISIPVVAGTNCFILAGGYDGLTGTLALHLEFISTEGPPMLLAEPADRTAPVGGSASFSLTASGTAPLSYYWARDGAFIAGATESIYTTNNVQLADSGARFSCLVSNVLGLTNSRSAMLAVATNAHPRVAIYAAEGALDWDLEVKTNLLATGLFDDADVDVYDLGSGTTPALAELQQYAAILTWSDGPYADSIAFGNVLADYVDSGGGLVIGAYAWGTTGNGIAGRIVSYLPLTLGGLAADSPHLVLLQDLPEHPVLQGISLFDGGFYSRRHTLGLAAGSLLLAHWSDNLPLAAVRTPGSGAVVGLNFRPTSNGINPFGWQAGTDGGRLLANALNWAAASAQAAPPRILSQPTNMTIASGETAAFNVVATGSRPLVYSWQRNGQPIAGATLSSYSNINQSLSENGTWFNCVVSNPYGSVLSSNAVLTVLALPPVVQQAPADQTVANGGAATFCVTATGSTPMGFVWQRNGSPIAGATLSCYTATGVLSADSGSRYNCVITNAFGAVTSAPAIMMVIDDLVQNGGFETADLTGWSGNPVGVAITPIPTYVHSGAFGAQLGPVGGLADIAQTFTTVPGKSYRLSFWLSNPFGGTPNEFNVTWNGASLFDGVNLSGFAWTNLQFTITAASASATLRFAFRQDPSYFGLDDISVTDVEAVAPVIVRDPFTQVVGTSGNATFSVLASGSAPLSYFWQRDGAPITSATGSAYTLNGAQLADSGSQFSCLVSNAGGVAASQAGTLAVVSTNRFANNQPIVINDNTPATPYPAAITVAGQTGVVKRATVSLSGFAHTFPHDVGVLLAGPQGQTVVLMADAGGGNAVAGLMLSFDDDATNDLAEFTALTGVSYRPGSCGIGDRFPAPAPAQPYGTSLLELAGVDPNGQWSLYVLDDERDDGGIIAGGWSLGLTLTLGLPQIQQSPQGQKALAGGNAGFGVSASGAKTYAWRLNGANLVDGGRISGAATPLLTITNLQPADAGAYSVVVGNDVGSVVSPKANLAIAPAWTPVFVAGTPRYTNGELLLTLAGAPGSNYEVLVSTDLATWKTSRVLALTNRTASFTEPATNVPLRYYRARLAP